jgi:phage shock protein E
MCTYQQIAKLFFAALLVLTQSGFSFIAAAQDEEQSPLYAQAQRSAQRDGYILITTSALKQLLEQQPDLLLVDVRFPYEFASGHIPEAVSLPVDLRDRGDLPPGRRQTMLDVFGPDKGRTIVVYCRDFR